MAFTLMSSNEVFPRPTLQGERRGRGGVGRVLEECGSGRVRKNHPFLCLCVYFTIVPLILLIILYKNRSHSANIEICKGKK